MSKWYLEGFRQLMLAGLGNLESANLDILLVRTGSTAGTEEPTNLDDITTLNEHDGTNYVRKSLANVTVTIDAPNEWVELDCDDVEWDDLGAASGGDQAIGAVIFLNVGTPATDVPVAFIDSGGFPFNATGAKVTVKPNAEGALRLRQIAP